MEALWCQLKANKQTKGAVYKSVLIINRFESFSILLMFPLEYGCVTARYGWHSALTASALSDGCTNYSPPTSQMVFFFSFKKCEVKYSTVGKIHLLIGFVPRAAISTGMFETLHVSVPPLPLPGVGGTEPHAVPRPAPRSALSAVCR